MNSYHSKEEVNITPIDSNNDTTCSSQIKYVNDAPKRFSPFLSSINKENFPQKINLNQ